MGFMRWMAPLAPGRARHPDPVLRGKGGTPRHAPVKPCVIRVLLGVPGVVTHPYLGDRQSRPWLRELQTVITADSMCSCSDQNRLILSLNKLKGGAGLPRKYDDASYGSTQVRATRTSYAILRALEI